MNNSTNGQTLPKETSLNAEQEPIIVLTKEEQACIKGGAKCNCKTTDKRIKR